MRLWNRNFVLLMQGAFVSNIGDMLYSLAIGYYVFELTGSEAMLGLFSSITMLGFLVLGPIAGAFVDRLDRKGVMVWMDALRGVIMLVIGWLCMVNQLSTGVLMLLTIAISVAGVFFGPAYSSVVVDIVPAHELTRATSIESSSNMIVKVVSRAISGLLVVTIGVGPLIVFNGLSFIFSAISELFITVAPSPKQSQRKPIDLVMIAGDLRQGMDVVLHTSGLNTVFFMLVAINFLASGIISLLLVLSLAKGFDVAQHGYFLTFFSAGGLAGSLLISLLPMSGRWRLRLAFWGFLLQVPLFVWGFWSNSFWIIAAVFFVAAAGNSVGNVVFNSALMLLIPEDCRSTVIGFVMASSMGGSALSNIFYGLVAERVPLQIAGTVGMLLAVVPIIMLFASAEVRSKIIGKPLQDNH